MNATQTLDRFWTKVRRTDTCWLWQAATRQGYGAFWLNGRHVAAHRFAYELLVGPLPDGLHLDHLCRRRECVNPDHLEPVTCRENLLRSPVTFQGVNAGKNHCNHGHEFTPENTYVWRGHRICRACHRQRMATFRALRKARDQSAAIPRPTRTE